MGQMLRMVREYKYDIRGEPSPPIGSDPPPSTAVREREAGEDRRRKRGPTRDYETALRAAAMVQRVAPDGDWRPKLDEICEALDEEKIPFPKHEKAVVTDPGRIVAWTVRSCSRPLNTGLRSQNRDHQAIPETLS